MNYDSVADLPGFFAILRRFEPEDGLFIGTIPVVCHAATTGTSEAGATEMAEDFLLMVLDELVTQGAELARRVGISGAPVARLPDLKYTPNIGLLECALRAAGHLLTVQMKAT